MQQVIRQQWNVNVTWPQTNEGHALCFWAVSAGEARAKAQKWARRQGIAELTILKVMVSA